MTDAQAAPTAPDRTTDAPDHPLDPLTADEIRRARAVLAAAGLLAETTRFPLMALDEPAKEAVLTFRPGDPLDRRVFAVLLDIATGAVTEAHVSLATESVLDTRQLDPREAGQPPIMNEEYGLVDEIVKADETWRAAMSRRGITDLDAVCVCPLSAGNFGFADEEGRRMLRALSFLQHDPADSPWAHPIDGVVAYVDLIERRVLEVVDREVMPIPEEHGNYDEEAVGPPRTTLRPLEITQSEGPSFAVDGHFVRWENWSFRIGFGAREGLVLYQVSYRDGGVERPVIYRASLAEMVTVYGDPNPVRFWQNYFDAGEYNLGNQTNSLELGCDCLGEITYFDAVLADDHGQPHVLRNAVCMHEEDYGVLWKHNDLFTGLHETRRSRRLVVSFFVTVGNYDYGFYWYLYLDGSIQFEVKATGVLFTGAVPDGEYPWGNEVAPGLAGPYHQHLFNVRLDMMVDGAANAVDEVEVQRVGRNGSNPHGNAFTRQATRLRSESEGARQADPAAGRVWYVVTPDRRNRLGNARAYALIPQSSPALLAAPDSSIARRAAFATKSLWVTRYDPAEKHPAGDYPNQHPGWAGLPSWTARDRSIDGDDVVLWHTFGLTHLPRPEDWPVMPVEYCGFALKPVGFFDRNPALDVPRTADGHCHE